MLPVPNKEDLFLEELFRQRHDDLMRSARAMIRKFGAIGLDVESRAEEAVQETLYVAWKQIGDIMEKEDPFKWVCGILKKKVHEQMREDTKWIRNLMYVPLPKNGEDPAEKYENEDIRALLSKDEFLIMRKIYYDGYSYDELARELGISKTNLSTKISRIKQSARKKL